MTRLSVNINKIATLRNSRGGDIPNVVRAAVLCEYFGAEGITVHPRPDERHIRYADVYDLKKVITTELNIEGRPCDKFINLVLDIKPAQVTLVPDADNALTSNAGWDLSSKENCKFLEEVCKEFQKNNIRTSLFLDPYNKFIEQYETAKQIRANRIELYTAQYAEDYKKNPKKAIDAYQKAAHIADKIGLGVNAGHDLSLENLKYFIEQIPYISEVSIGHALISDALYMGLEKTIKEYLYQTHIKEQISNKLDNIEMDIRDIFMEKFGITIDKFRQIIK